MKRCGYVKPGIDSWDKCVFTAFSNRPMASITESQIGKWKGVRVRVRTTAPDGVS